MENRVYIRDIIPGKKYPKDTVFVQDESPVMIPMPTKEELEEYKKKHDTTSQ